MVLSHLIHKCIYKVYGKSVNSVVVVSVFREIALDFVACNDTVFVTYCFNFSIFYCAERIGNNGKSGNTRSEVSLYISVMKCHLNTFVAVFIVHIMDNVKCIYIKPCEPFHHGIVFFHNIVKVKIFCCYRTVFRTNLDFKTFVHTSVYSIKQAFCEVRSCTEELHFLAYSHRRYAASYSIVIAVDFTHHIIVFILNGRSVYGYFCAVFLKASRK